MRTPSTARPFTTRHRPAAGPGGGYGRVAVLVGALLGACCAALPVRAQGTEPPAVLLVGDSTMAPQTGYGDALCARLEPAVACLNLARGGRSTLSYRAEGLWTRVLARLQAGQPGVQRLVLIQFGHNDQPGKPGRSTDLATEFPANLQRYVEETRAAGGTPVLVTPLTRRSFRDGQLQHDLAAWAEAVRGVARRLDVPLLDLNASSAALVQSLGQAGADTLAQGPVGTSAFDRTHLGERGACFFAGQVAAGLQQQAALWPAVAAALQPGADCQAVPAAGVLPPATGLNRATYDQPGWAVGTLGGRGGRVLRVSNLNASGPGSLRAALETPGPRLVVFEVGGVIDLQGASLTLRHPFVTLAGQTAPRPGITLIKGELNIATHDVIVQHLMFRPGAYGRAPRSGGDHDGISTQGGARQVIVDHCSFSWATDENLSIGGPRFDGDGPTAWRRAAGHDITFSHNLLFEGLGHSVHPKGEHSKGTLVHDNATGVLLLGNVYASHRERNALFKGGVHAAMVNNLIYNPGTRAVHYNLVAHEWAGQPHQTGQVALVGNVLRHGPDTAAGTPLFTLGGQGDVELHLHDNLAADRQGQPVAMTGRYTQGAARILPAATPYLPPRLRVLPAAQLEDQVLLAVGARPWDRDPIDFKALSDLAEDRGRIPDSETESSGHPRYKPTQQAFDPAAWDLRDMSPHAGWASLFTPKAK
ncbi:MAG: GDSL-type esterase/lipase family protein [Rubrivivax sp.]